MIRLLLKQTVFTRSSCTGAAVRFNSNDSGLNRPKEIREAKIIGTIYQNPLTLDNGAKILTVKTVQPDNYYKVHRVFIRNQKILGLIGDNLSIGQRVYVSGELRSTTFANNQNQNRQRLQIQANELYTSQAVTIKTNASDAEDRENTEATKFNAVFLLSQIISDIQHYENYSRFFMSSNFTASGDVHKLGFFNIFVHDPNLVNYVKENLQKKDRILVNGFLNAKPEIDQNGEKTFSGFVEATSILKIDRVSRISNESPIDEEIKSASE